MSANHLSEITDEMIESRLNNAIGVRIEFIGQYSMKEEAIRELENEGLERLREVGAYDVRWFLGEFDFLADSALEEVEWAIAASCEPDGLPDNAAFIVEFSDN